MEWVIFYGKLFQGLLQKKNLFISIHNCLCSGTIYLLKRRFTPGLTFVKCTWLGWLRLATEPLKEENITWLLFLDFSIKLKSLWLVKVK